MQKITERWNRLWPDLSRWWAFLLREIEVLLGRKHLAPMSRPMPDTMRLPLRIVFYREGDDWIAHCLEFDLMGNGPTQQDALAILCEAIAIQIEASIEHQNPANLFSPADGKYFQMFASGKNVARAELHLQQLPSPRVNNFEIEDCEYREYVGGATCGV